MVWLLQRGEAANQTVTDREEKALTNSGDRRDLKHRIRDIYRSGRTRGQEGRRLVVPPEMELTSEINVASKEEEEDNHLQSDGGDDVEQITKAGFSRDHRLLDRKLFQRLKKHPMLGGRARDDEDETAGNSVSTQGIEHASEKESGDDLAAAVAAANIVTPTVDPESVTETTSESESNYRLTTQTTVNPLPSNPEVSRQTTANPLPSIPAPTAPARPTSPNLHRGVIQRLEMSTENNQKKVSEDDDEPAPEPESEPEVSLETKSESLEKQKFESESTVKSNLEPRRKHEQTPEPEPTQEPEPTPEPNKTPEPEPTPEPETNSYQAPEAILETEPEPTTEPTSDPEPIFEDILEHESNIESNFITEKNPLNLSFEINTDNDIRERTSSISIPSTPHISFSQKERIPQDHLAPSSPLLKSDIILQSLPELNTSHSRVGFLDFVTTVGDTVMHFTLSSPEVNQASLLTSYPVAPLVLPSQSITTNRPIITASPVISSSPPTNTAYYPDVIRPTAAQTTKSISQETSSSSVKVPTQEPPTRPTRPTRPARVQLRNTPSPSQDSDTKETEDSTETDDSITTLRPDKRLTFQEKLLLKFKKFRKSPVAKVLSRPVSQGERRQASKFRRKEEEVVERDRDPQQNRRIELLRLKLQKVITHSSEKLNPKKTTLVRTFIPAHLRTKAPSELNTRSTGETI